MHKGAFKIPFSTKRKSHTSKWTAQRKHENVSPLLPDFTILTEDIRMRNQLGFLQFLLPLYREGWAPTHVKSLEVTLGFTPCDLEGVIVTLKDLRCPP